MASSRGLRDGRQINSQSSPINVELPPARQSNGSPVRPPIRRRSSTSSFVHPVGGVKRIGNRLYFSYPDPATLTCPEADCDSTFSSRHGVGRHMLREHGVTVKEPGYRCLGCNNDLGKRPRDHKCTEQARLDEAKANQSTEGFTCDLLSESGEPCEYIGAT